MKRVQSACIFQTLLFSQKPELELSPERALFINQTEVSDYLKRLERTHIRYLVVRKQEQEDGSILLHIRKQYNDRISVQEYFDL